MPIKDIKTKRPPRKANYRERVGRKVTGLKPPGKGSGTTEVETKDGR